MPQPPQSRAAAARSTDDVGEIEVAPPTVLETSLLVAAARLDNSVDPSEFRDMLEAMIEAVRHDERQRAAAMTAKPAKRVIKFLTEADAIEIRRRAAEVRNGRTKLPQGWKAKIAAEFGYSPGQIDQAVYHQGV